LSAPAAKVLAHSAVGIENLISAGDDYEILGVIPENRFDAFAKAAQLAGVAVSSIGSVISGLSAPKFLDARGIETPLSRPSYSHF
jgi:thiamine-monophosphate kinase